MKLKKGQFNFIDFIMGLVIFAILITLFFRYSSNITKEQEGITGLAVEGRTISNDLLSEGFPSNWNSSNVVIIGITNNNNQINETKLQNLINISYQQTRTLFRTKYQYYLHFLDSYNSVIKITPTQEGIGYPGVDSSNIEDVNTKKLIKLERIVFFRNQMAKLVLYLWE